MRNASYALAFLGADSVAMEEQQKWFAGKPQFEHLGLSLASDTEAYSGHVLKSLELTRRAVESAIRADSKESGAIWQAIAAQRAAAYGNVVEARKTATEALRLAPASQGAESEAALAFAMAGDLARAELLAQDLVKRFPLDTQVQSLWLPAIRAQLALDRKNPAFALNALQDASPLELGQIQFVINFSCLYPVYVRGEAYLAAEQGRAAATEFFRSFSIPTASYGTAGRERWHNWVWRGRTRCSRECRRVRMRMPLAFAPLPLTKTSSRSGKTPMPTSQSSSKPRQSTQNCNNCIWNFSSGVRCLPHKWSQHVP